MATVATSAKQGIGFVKNLTARVLIVPALIALGYYVFLNPIADFSPMVSTYVLFFGIVSVLEVGQILLHGFDKEAIIDDFQATGWYTLGLLAVFHFFDRSLISYRDLCIGFDVAAVNHLFLFIVFEKSKKMAELVVLVILLLIDKNVPLDVIPTEVSYLWGIYNTQASAISMCVLGFTMGSYNAIFETITERRKSAHGSADKEEEKKDSVPSTSDQVAAPPQQNHAQAPKPTAPAQPAQKAQATQQGNGKTNQGPVKVSSEQKSRDLISEILDGNNQIIQQTFILLKQLEDKVAEFMAPSGMPQHVQKKMLKSPEAMVQVISHSGFGRGKDGSPSQKECFLRLLLEGPKASKSAPTSNGNMPAPKNTVEDLVNAVVDQRPEKVVAAKKIATIFASYEPRHGLEEYLAKSALGQNVIDTLLSGSTVQIVQLLKGNYELGEIVIQALEEIVELEV